MLTWDYWWNWHRYDQGLECWFRHCEFYQWREWAGWFLALAGNVSLLPHWFHSPDCSLHKARISGTFKKGTKLKDKLTFRLSGKKYLGLAKLALTKRTRTRQIIILVDDDMSALFEFPSITDLFVSSLTFVWRRMNEDVESLYYGAFNKHLLDIGHWLLLCHFRYVIMLMYFDAPTWDVYYGHNKRHICNAWVRRSKTNAWGLFLALQEPQFSNKLGVILENKWFWLTSSGM